MDWNKNDYDSYHLWHTLHETSVSKAANDSEPQMKMNKSKTTGRDVLSSFVDSNVTGYAYTHVLKH